ncbi:hypothetical protein Aperf_G00000038268 [Anoplocephala perfoliata]
MGEDRPEGTTDNGPHLTVTPRAAIISNGEEEEEEYEVNRHIPDDFFYNIEDVMTKPHMPADSGLPENLVKLYHSFGCDTFRRDNLKILDVDNIGFVVGNYFEIRNLVTGERQYLRSTAGTGIGAVDIHPERTYIAIAERGDVPDVCIYEYPSLKLYRILHEGTQTAYSSCQFSPDGSLLVTVGDEPDYLLTVWNWREEGIVLRNKAFSQEIFRVRWSDDLHGVLVTAGSGHIRFWRMADTFTGLKLQGSIGKFGKVELSDIEGFVIMPDGKVLSGCEWGNLLLWEGDLIKVQICRKDKNPCHDGLIMQILIYEGELITIGTDGYIRTWEFDSIDQAEAQEEGTFLELEPMNELKVSPRAKLMSLQKLEADENVYWYCMDAQDGIWKLDLSFSHRSAPPQLIVPYHAGAIMACTISPTSHIVATLGSDGTVRVFDILKKQQLGQKRFSSSGRCMIWVPQELDSKSKTLVGGFADGVVRVMQITTDDSEANQQDHKEAVNIELIQVLKPHTQAILSMDFDPKGNFFATSSEDCTIFIFNLNGLHLVPSGFARLPVKAFQIRWRYADTEANTPTLVLFMDRSYVLEVSVPYHSTPEKGSFEITDVKVLQGLQMESVAGSLRVAEQSAQKRLAYELEKRKRQENLQKLLNEGHINEEDLTRANDDEKKLHAKVEDEIAHLKAIAPEVPSPVIGGMICNEDPNLLWINLGDFDAGYFYKCAMMDLTDPSPKITEQLQVELKEERILTELETVLPRVRAAKPLQTATLIDCGDSALLTWKFTASGNRAVMGFENGLLRVQMLNKPFDFSELGPFWMYVFADNNRGAVKGLELTFDDAFIVTVGADGTLFVLELMSEAEQEKEVNRTLTKLPSSSHEPVVEEDIQDANEFSIEQARKKMEWDKLIEAGEEKKRETRKQIAELRLRFKRLKELNERLPAHMRINSRQYEMLDQLRNKLLEQREEQIETLNKEMAFESRRKSIALQKMINRFRKGLSCEYIVLKAFGTSDRVSSIRKSELPQDHMELLAHLREAISQENEVDTDYQRKTGKPDRLQSRSNESAFPTGSDLIFRSRVKGARGLRYVRELEAMEAKRLKRERRRKQWEELYALKPSSKWEDPLDVMAINAVKNNMGDYKLKSSPNYTVPEQLKPTGLKSRLALLEAITQISERQDDFNRRLLKLRNKKATIIKELKKIDENLKRLSDDLPPEGVTVRLKIDNLDDEEFPERAFDVTEAALEAYKNSLSVTEEEKVKVKKAESFDEGTEPECSLDVTIVMHGDKRVLYLSTARLLKSKCFYTLDLNIPHRPEVLGLPLYFADPNNTTFDASTRVLEMSQPLQPDTMIDTIVEESTKKDSTRMDSPPGDKSHQDLFERTFSQDSEENLHLEMSRQNLRHIRALYKQRYLVTEAGAMVRGFNMELRTLSHQKVNLDLLLKRANLNLLILYEEYKLLMEFEQAEQGLTVNYDDKVKEKNEVDQKVVDNENEIEMTLAIIERSAVKENEIFEDFKEFLGENNKWGDFLQKVYRKRVKRKVRGSVADRGSGEGSSSASSFSEEDSEWNESDEAEDAENDIDDDLFGEGEGGAAILDLDICPPGCLQSDYDQTVAFRERRLDVEDEIAEQKRSLEALRREAEVLAKKAKSAQQNLQQATTELQAFQLEKQRKLNVIERMVSLRLNQINYFQEKSLPSNFEPVLVFRNENIAGLRSRIQALEDEKRAQGKEKMHAKEKYLMLQRHKKVFLEELQKMSMKCDAMMIDKFGRLDDIERLESIHPKAEEITLRVLALQARIQREEREAEERLRDARDVYVVQLRENTRLVMKTLMLFNELQALSSSMASHMHNPATFLLQNREKGGGLTAKREELNTRLRVVLNQAEEINKLTAEYRCLSAKVPKVLPAVQAPPNMLPNNESLNKSTNI